MGYSVSLLEAPGHEATVVGHTPEFDHDRKLWYCDLQVDAGSSYFPFVKLALARYQPDSITGQHLSKVVFPDFAQLVAERTAALTKIGRSGVRVSLRGPAGYTYIADVLASDEDERMNLSRFVVAQVERLPANATTDLAWSAAGDEVRLELAAQPSTTDVRFSGTLPLPTRADGEQLRVALARVRDLRIRRDGERRRDRPAGAGRHVLHHQAREVPARVRGVPRTLNIIHSS